MSKRATWLGLAIVLIIQLSATLTGCKPSEDSGRTYSSQEFALDASRFNESRDRFNRVVANDDENAYTTDQKIEACEAYLSIASDILSKYPDGTMLSDGTIVRSSQIKKDIETVQGALTQLLERERLEYVKEIRGQILRYGQDAAKLLRGLEALQKKGLEIESDREQVLRLPKRDRKDAYLSLILPKFQLHISEIEGFIAECEEFLVSAPSYDESKLKDNEQNEFKKALHHDREVIKSALSNARQEHRNTEANIEKTKGLAEGSGTFSRFSDFVKYTGAVPRVNDPKETRSIGCSDGKYLAYLDLNGSNVQTARFAPVLSFWQKIGSDVGKRQGISSLLYGNLVLSGESLIGMVFNLKEEEEGPGLTLKLDLRISSDHLGTLLVTKIGDIWNEIPAVNSTMDCELYSDSYVPIPADQNVIYDCSGFFSVHMNRPFNLAPVAQYKREDDFFGSPASCDSYHKHSPVAIKEARDGNGESISKLEWVKVGGVLKYVDRVNYRETSGSHKAYYYYRHLESDLWQSVIGANPPAEFTIERTDAAPWYQSTESSCGNSQGYRSKHVCRRRQ